MFDLIKREYTPYTLPELFQNFLDAEPTRFWGKEFVPTVDIKETDTGILVTAEVPGMTKESLSVTLENNVLTISGEKKETEEVKEKEYYRSERRYGKFSRSFTVPAGVDAKKVTATFEAGVLKVELPKATEALPHKVEVTAK